MHWKLAISLLYGAIVRWLALWRKLWRKIAEWLPTALPPATFIETSSLKDVLLATH